MNHRLLVLAATLAALPARADILQDRADFWAAYGLVPDGIETFETLPMPHDSSVMSFTQNGITYNALGGNPLVVHSAGSHGQFAPSLMPTTSSVLTGNGYDHFELVFQQPLKALFLDWYHNGPRGWTSITMYNAAGESMGNLFMPVGNDAIIGTYAGHIVNPANWIVRLEFENQFGEVVNGGIDNVEWALAPVPEPASGLLMLAGTAALLFRRRILNRLEKS